MSPVHIQAHTLRVQPLADRAITSQAQIGWLHAFRGFVSRDWCDFYSPDDMTPQENRISESNKSLARVILAVQDYSLALWMGRNSILHDANSEGSAILHASLNRAITQLYAVSATLSPTVQSYFSLPLADRLKRSPRQRKRWLRLAQLATSHSSASGSRQQLVTTYYRHALAAAPAAVTPTAPPLLQQQYIADFFVPRATEHDRR